MQRQYMYIVAVLVMAMSLLLGETLSAQAEEPLSTKGKDFRIAFLPNYHNNASSREDTLYIFVVSEEPCSGQITYFNRAGNRRIRNFNLTGGGDFLRFPIVWDELELRSINQFYLGITVPADNSDSEIITKLSARVETDADVTVYALSQATLTADACIVYPVPALGKEYYVMAYESDINTSFGRLDNSSTPSQFVVVATEDDTEVEIVAPTPTHRQGLIPQRVVLQEGETYLVQSRLTLADAGSSDLSGSKVTASKPVAVFGGQQRARLPFSSLADAPSRDLLVAQVPPIDVWGKEYVITPFQQPGNIDNAPSMGRDRFRIMAAFDGTEVRLGNRTIRLGAGRYIEEDLITPQFATSNLPILVTTYKRSSGQNNTRRDGDPFMLILPSIEQFANRYRFVSVDAALPGTRGRPTYTDHFITVTVRQDAAATLQLDGVPLLASFQNVPGSQYAFANVRIGAGPHLIESDEDFALYAYGYGDAVSYGYAGGGLMKVITDLIPPEIRLSGDCGSFLGTITDPGEAATGLSSVTIEESENIEVTVDYEQEDISGTLIVRLENRFEDGSFRMVASDMNNNSTSASLEIPGFTLHTDPEERGNIPVQVRTSLPVFLESCFETTVTNYGKFEQLIEFAEFSNENLTITTEFPQTIAPGQTIVIEYCANIELDDIVDTLIIGNRCDIRVTLAVEITAIPDEVPPVFSAVREDDCGTAVITVEETGEPLSGIAEVLIPSAETINCTIDLLESRVMLRRYRVNVVNPREDAFATFIVEDRAGNRAEYEFVAPGYTIEYVERAGERETDFGTVDLGELVCDTLLLRNYGIFPIVYPNIATLQNTFFSFPPAQFPLVVEPGATKPLVYCFDVRVSDEVNDLFRLGNSCLTDEFSMRGIGRPFSQLYDTRCEAVVRVETLEGDGTLFVGDAFPNPASERVTFRVVLPREQNITINIVDNIGATVDRIELGTIPQGFSSIEINVTELAGGAYTAIMRVGTQVFRRNFIVIR